MTAAAPVAPPQGAGTALGRIVTAGLGGGGLDFVYACAMALSKGRSVQQLWQGVASGLIGKAAGEGGWLTAGLGIAIHFAIATVMALAYALAARRAPVLYRRPWLCGVLYGFLLYAVMYGLVLPLRFGAPYRWNGLQSVGDIAAHIGVALVIALVLSRRRAA